MMKKVLYIGIAVVALGLASCSKEDIRPNATSDTTVPVLKSGTGGGGFDDPNTGSNEGGITDPNTEEELVTAGSSDGSN